MQQQGAVKSKSNITNNKSAALSGQDKTFTMKAVQGGKMEVQWGQWAAQNGQNADVKKFGNRMVGDHSKANNELQTLAAQKGVWLKTEKVKGEVDLGQRLHGYDGEGSSTRFGRVSGGSQERHRSRREEVRGRHFQDYPKTSGACQANAEQAEVTNPIC